MTLTPPTYECPTVHPRDTIRHDNDLMPYPERGAPRFRAGRGQQQQTRHSRASENPEPFTDEQRWWLEKMAEHIASNLGLEADDFGYAPFDQRGALGRVHQLFGAELPMVIDELNRELVA
ncbi:type I restriction-modification enzyme R subunit C-terminal domain-containing protein [Methylolobus aquaticus]